MYLRRLRGGPVKSGRRGVIGQIGFQSWLGCFLVGWPWSCYLTSLYSISWSVKWVMIILTCMCDASRGETWSGSIAVLEPVGCCEGIMLGVWTSNNSWRPRFNVCGGWGSRTLMNLKNSRKRLDWSWSHRKWVPRPTCSFEQGSFSWTCLASWFLSEISLKSCSLKKAWISLKTSRGVWAFYSWRWGNYKDFDGIPRLKWLFVRTLLLIFHLAIVCAVS